MRQAPLQYAVIGDGRMANHFCHYLDLSGVSFSRWSRSADASLLNQLSRATCIVLLISDQAIEPFIQQHAVLAGKRIIHFSGAQTIAGATGMHPLFSFPSHLYSLETYQKIPFIVDQDNVSFQDVFPMLLNPSFSIDPLKKPYYHALCVMANNFTTLLWRKFCSEMEGQFAIPSEFTHLFLEQTADNIVNNSQTALTGPLVRGDRLTIEENLAALEGDAYQSVYQAFVNVFNKGASDENGS